MASDPVVFTLEELRALPVPDFAERDPAIIRQKLVARFEEITGRTLYPAQTEMFMISLMAYALSNMGSAVQNGLIQNRAIWAESTHLDGLGANVGTFRLGAQLARAEVEFTLSEVRNTAVVIPSGTRVSAGSELIFQTDQELVIPAGEWSGIVDTTATASGATYNDLQLGQIQDILDPVAYVSAVSNVQISAGGSEAEADERLLERIVNASDGITQGGSRSSYIELVKAAHPDIVDVEVIRLEPGHIHIYPLMSTGIAADAIDDLIIASLDVETKIPMGDYIAVQKVTPRVFDVEMTLKVTPGYATGAVALAETVIQAQFAALSQSLGAQVAPSASVEVVRAISGVVGVDGPDFGFTDLGSSEFAQLGALNINLVEAPNV